MNHSTTIPASWQAKRGTMTTRKVGKLYSPFLTFLYQKKANRILGCVALTAGIVQLIIFKTLYPFPDFMVDSYNYIGTASLHLPVNIWPVGYGKFLALIHQISHSDLLIIAIQYFLLEAALSYLFFTILYLYRPGKKTRTLLFLFFFFNPLFLYVSNCILSDAIFAALSILFLVQFLWMLHKPALSQVIIQGVIIGMAFTVRYTALYYPLVTVAGLLLSRHQPAVKAWGSVLGIGLIIPFVLVTQQKTKELTGTGQFSVFGGWQIANNALYMYSHIIVDSTLLPKETLALNGLATQFFKTVPDSQRNLAVFQGSFFIAAPYAPLQRYMGQENAVNETGDQFKAWAKVSPVYSAFGQSLIARHPLAYSRYFLWPNLKKYFQPSLEKFESYNMGMNTVPTNVQDWFGYITPDVLAVSSTFQGALFFLYPSLFLVLNLYFLGMMVWLLGSRRFRILPARFWKATIILSIFLGLNAGFSILAEPVVLRYQIVPMIVLFTFSLLFLDFMDRKKQQKINTNQRLTAAI